MATDKVSDELWDEFHHVVNMTSRELTDWLRAEAADEQAEPVPDQAWPPVGQQVVHILGKRRTDLTPEDAEVMEAVVDAVRRERPDEFLEPTAGDAQWRHRLMSLGHDPLKPVD
jgi:hypothetical protein